MEGGIIYLAKRFDLYGGNCFWLIRVKFFSFSPIKLVVVRTGVNEGERAHVDDAVSITLLLLRHYNAAVQTPQEATEASSMSNQQISEFLDKRAMVETKACIHCFGLFR